MTTASASISRPSPADPWTWQPADPARIDQQVGLLRLEGPDSLRVLHGQTSQAIEAARAGQWLSTCCITPTARLRALAEVLVDEHGAWLVITAGDAAMVRQALDRVLFPADRVVLGELRRAVLATPLGPAGPAGGPTPGQAAAGSRHWKLLEEGEGWWLGSAALVPEGQPLPAVLADRRPLDEAERERWRFQRGLPEAPSEINEGTNPFELGLAERVSLTKGCYVGQETLAKLATYDGVKQQLRRWHCAAPQQQGDGAPGAAVLRSGMILRNREGERAGTITSALQLAGERGTGRDGWIGLALVRRQALAESRLRAGESTAGGEESSGLEVELSLPEDFVAPPVGAGGGAGGDQRGGPSGGAGGGGPSGAGSPAAAS
jgi:tRNA-modifying protein YgfZ